MPLAERSIPGGSMVLAALILALCGYGTWFYLSDAERSRPERVTEVPVDLLAPKAMPLATIPSNAAVPKTVMTADQPPPARVDAVASAAPPTAEISAAPATAAPAIESTAALSAPVSTSGTEQVVAPAVAADGSASGNSSDGQKRVVLRATADSWIAVRDADRAVIFTRLLKPGDSYEVPDQIGLSLRTGNAGGLEITVDGKPVPPIGPNGAIRGNVALDPQALIAGTAVRN
jgi:cytoskeleton protein RodZ